MILPKTTEQAEVEAEFYTRDIVLADIQAQAAEWERLAVEVCSELSAIIETQTKQTVCVKKASK